MIKLFTFLYIISLSLFAQEGDMPDYDIMMFKLELRHTDSGNSFIISDGKVVADAEGYDNQPFFADENTIYYTHMEDVNADLWRWQNGKQTKITNTLESEYSPTLIPHIKGAISTVRVEQNNAQRLWQVNPDGSFKVIFNDIKPVGYHAWSKGNIALFILGDPHSLHIVKKGRKQSEKVDDKIGRSLQAVPSSNSVSYSRLVDGVHKLKLYDFSNGNISELFSLPIGTEDYTWYNNDIIVSSDGSQLMWRSVSNGFWQKVENTDSYELNNISRLAVSPGGLSIAVVHEK